MQDNGTEVTAAGIARLAGVGRAAVSNWRRRHTDFPKPIGGTETSPSFALADIEEWLRRQGKLAEVPLRERVWQQTAGHPEGPVTALVHAGCALVLVHDRPTVWKEASAGSDARLAELLPTALEQVLTPRTGVPVPTPAELLPSARCCAPPPSSPPSWALQGHTSSCSDAISTPTTPVHAHPGRSRRPDGGPRRPRPDGSRPGLRHGALLRAVAPAPAQELHGQDSDQHLAALSALRLTLHTKAAVRTAAGDSLRADAFDTLRADAVLCHPPFNERNWGHDELAYDPRWEYGFPARMESELAWVQHALARLKDGGTAVLLMPPAAASRRSGRRIRADLLRRGALRAVLALPAGAAPPHNIPLHLWVLRRPASAAVRPELLVADAGALTAEGRGGPDWQAVRSMMLDAWRRFARNGRHLRCRA